MNIAPSKTVIATVEKREGDKVTLSTKEFGVEILDIGLFYIEDYHRVTPGTKIIVGRDEKGRPIIEFMEKE